MGLKKATFWEKSPDELLFTQKYISLVVVFAEGDELLQFVGHNK